MYILPSLTNFCNSLIRLIYYYNIHTSNLERLFDTDQLNTI